MFFALIMCCFLVSLMSLFWKWSKALLVIIMMEALTVIILSTLLFMNSSTMYLMVFLFAFMVSESLILISSFYSSLRVTGLSYSSILIS